MTASDVSNLISREITSVDAGWPTRPENNPHSLDFSKCLVKPQRVKCKNTFPQFRRGKPFEAWLVLTERPTSDDGYLIIFDEEMGFGLADGPKSEPVFLGWHGSFLNTVQGM